MLVSEFKTKEAKLRTSKLIPSINTQTFRIRKSMYRNDRKKPEVQLSENKDLVKKNEKLPFRGLIKAPDGVGNFHSRLSL